MHLTGSEYHSYFLPDRVGQATANQLLEAAEPLLAETAEEMGLIDLAMGQGAAQFQEQVEELAKRVARDSSVETVPQLALHLRRERRRTEQDFPRLLEQKRAKELAAMARDFRGDLYSQARRAFVFH
jgi:enoyl-CoA hydratase/carnithine racemase